MSGLTLGVQRIAVVSSLSARSWANDHVGVLITKGYSLGFEKVDDVLNRANLRRFFRTHVIAERIFDPNGQRNGS